LEILPQLLAVLGVFGLLGATLWWLRRRGMVSLRHRPSRARLLTCADALQLSPTHALSLVRMGDRAILIGTSPAGFCLIESSQWKSVEGTQTEA
jgi:flagellar biogenesis protein FliO